MAAPIAKFRSRLLKGICCLCLARALLGLACFAPIVVEADPDRANIEAGLAEIVIFGPNESEGNNPEISRGSGFFIDKYGRFVTANHVLTNLFPEVNRASISIQVTIRACDSRARDASILYENPRSDLMVLIVDIENCAGIIPLIKSSLIEANVDVGFSIWTVGFADPGHTWWSSGTVSSMIGHPRPPLPRILVDLMVASGQSGGPVLASDGKVIAVAVASIDGSIRPALATPITELPFEHFANSASLGKAPISVTVASVQAAPTIIARAEVAPLPRRRKIEVSLANSDPCSGPQAVEFSVKPEPGWTLDAVTARLVPASLVGHFVGDSLPEISSEDDGIAVRGLLSNAGECAKVSMPVLRGFVVKTVQRMISTNARVGKFAGTLEVTEIPKDGFVVDQEVASTRVLAGLKTGLEKVDDDSWSLGVASNAIRDSNSKIVPISDNLATRALEGRASAVSAVANSVKQAADKM